MNVAPEEDRREKSKAPETNPSHFAPENPTNRELAKERWYTRAAWAAIGIGYSTALFGITYGEGVHATRTTVTGLLIDTIFAYLALRNSEVRKFILDGSVLPPPGHADKQIGQLLAVGSVFNFLSAASNASLAAALFVVGDYSTAVLRTGVFLLSLHLGCAWLRRVRFFRSLDRQ
jgi:hypothetical protein